jgi:hypothetical protein
MIRFFVHTRRTSRALLRPFFYVLIFHFADVSAFCLTYDEWF